MKHRPIGLGIMGLQDALFKLDLPFDSQKALNFSDQLMEQISYHAISASSDLAKERGAYGSFEGSKWDRGIFPLDSLSLLEEERGQNIDVNKITSLDWEGLKSKVKENGMRNSNTMAIAPTATISNIAGCYPCIEPIYKNIYVRRIAVTHAHAYICIAEANGMIPVDAFLVYALVSHRLPHLLMGIGDDSSSLLHRQSIRNTTA